jgi:transcriptional regulator GlxA family with amidase domain
MTYCNSQVQKLQQQIYPKDYLTQQVIKAKHFIDNNFAEKTDLDAIAAAGFLSKFHFTRLFRSLYGITPHQYLTAVRIKQAKHLLQKNTSITAVCIAVGFESVTSFTGLFKKITGNTPAAYKRKKQFSRRNYVQHSFAL